MSDLKVLGQCLTDGHLVQLRGQTVSFGPALRHETDHGSATLVWPWTASSSEIEYHVAQWLKAIHR